MLANATQMNKLVQFLSQKSQWTFQIVKMHHLYLINICFLTVCSDTKISSFLDAVFVFFLVSEAVECITLNTDTEHFLVVK